MREPRWKVTDNGDVPRHTSSVTIEFDGIDVTSGVVGYEVRHDRHGRAQLVLIVEPVEVSALGDSEPQWLGLDRLPASALRQALAEVESREGAA